jgi:hypothetical protein
MREERIGCCAFVTAVTFPPDNPSKLPYLPLYKKNIAEFE